MKSILCLCAGHSFQSQQSAQNTVGAGKKAGSSYCVSIAVFFLPQVAVAVPGKVAAFITRVECAACCFSKRPFHFF